MIPSARSSTEDGSSGEGNTFKVDASWQIEQEGSYCPADAFDEGAMNRKTNARNERGNFDISDFSSISVPTSVFPGW
jgi:hypothetical protein